MAMRSRPNEEEHKEGLLSALLSTTSVWFYGVWSTFLDPFPNAHGVGSSADVATFVQHIRIPIT